MTRSPGPLFGSIFSTLLLASCGNITSGVSADKACTDQAQARCTQRSACSINGSRLLRDFGDLNSCLTREKLACMNGLMAPGTGNSAAGVEACATATMGLDCNDFLDGTTPAACIFSGPLADGASCIASAQCQHSFCGIPKGSACGTCQPLPGAGATCTSIGCGRDLICQQSNMTCTAYGVMGSSCNRDNPCGAGFSCVGSNNMTGVMGTCQTAIGMAGAACDARQQMGSGCDTFRGITCNTGLNCVAVTFGSDGAACGLQTDLSFASCSNGGVCFPLGARTGTCKAAAADGAACDLVAGPLCLSPARCITSGGSTAGTCQIVNPVSCK